MSRRRKSSSVSSWSGWVWAGVVAGAVALGGTVWGLLSWAGVVSSPSDVLGSMTRPESDKNDAMDKQTTLQAVTEFTTKGKDGKGLWANLSDFIGLS